jgi:hypothetical protein
VRVERDPLRRILHERNVERADALDLEQTRGIPQVEDALADDVRGVLRVERLRERVVPARSRRIATVRLCDPGRHVRVAQHRPLRPGERRRVPAAVEEVSRLVGRARRGDASRVERDLLVGQITPERYTELYDDDGLRLDLSIWLGFRLPLL